MLCRLQLGEEVFLLPLHQPGALLQLGQDARQALAGGLFKHLQVLAEAGLEILVTLHAARYIALHVVDQIDRVLLPGAGVRQFIADDVLAKQFGGRLRREVVEVVDHPVQVPIELRLLALAVGVPERVVHRVGRNVVTNHQRHCLLEQRRRLAGVFWIQR
ncbi:hypothetical protein D3C84_647080 [compost metagenome]